MDAPETLPSGMQDESFVLALPDAELYLELHGLKDAPPLYYLHGGPGYNSYSFRDLMEEDLQDYRTIYADQRGAGRSRSDDPASALDPARLAQDAVTVLEALEIPEVTFLAHGFGALVALTLAQQYPERVKRLILVNPWVDMPTLARNMQRQAALLSGNRDSMLPPEEALAEGLEPAALEPAALVEEATGWVNGKRLLDSMLFPHANTRMRLEHSDAGGVIASGIDLDAETLPETLWRLSVLESLPTIHVPTVVLAGKSDLSIYPDMLERLLERMPHALLSLHEGGHYLWLDDEEGFVSILHEAMKL